MTTRKRTLANTTHEGRFEMFDQLVTRSQSVVSVTELFVSLPEHGFARAALMRVASPLARVVPTANSLTFLSGTAGSGKSLLVRQAILDALYRQPKFRFLIATAVELVELLVIADERQSLAELLERFGTLNLIVCEDLLGIEGLPLEQQMLLSLLDRSMTFGSRILVTSQKRPGELRNFSPRWVSRCHGGLCVSLSWPGLESRSQLISRLTNAKHVPLREPASEAIQWLAEHWPFSPREIVCAVSNLADYCGLHQVVLDVPVLERYHSEQALSVSPSMDTIANVVAAEFGIDSTDLRSRSRNRELIVPRQCAMFFAREFTGRPLEAIGLYFGQRTHTTVSHGLSRLKKILPHAPTISQQLQKIRNRLSENRREDCA